MAAEFPLGSLTLQARHTTFIKILLNPSPPPRETYTLPYPHTQLRCLMVQEDLVTQSASLTSHHVWFLSNVCVCVFPTDSENSYTLSCGVPVQPGKAPQKRNATAALPTCAGTVCQAWWEMLCAFLFPATIILLASVNPIFSVFMPPRMFREFSQ